MYPFYNRYEVSSFLFDNLVKNLTDDKPKKCLIFEPIPIVSEDFNDGCTDGLKVGEHGYYLTSAAKQKRALLSKYRKYGINVVICEGRYIRPDEIIDNTHLPYLTQYDWEVKIVDRSIYTLEHYVNAVWKSIYDTAKHFELISKINIDEKVKYISSESLRRMYPLLTPDERVAKYMYAHEHNVVFVIGIGANLEDGKPHDTRAKDYDDHELNGDLFVLHKKLLMPLELMSCGIRVNAESLEKQLGTKESTSEYHQKIFNDEYVQCVGGGLGVERTLMYLFNLADIRDTFPKF